MDCFGLEIRQTITSKKLLFQATFVTLVHQVVLIFCLTLSFQADIKLGCDICILKM